MIYLEYCQNTNNFSKALSKADIKIDLSHKGDRDSIITTIGNTLKGKDSPTLQTGNFDAFIDVLSDWFIDNIDCKKTVYIIVNRKKIDSPKTLEMLILCLNAAYMRGLLNADKTIEEIKEVRFRLLLTMIIIE